MTEKRLEITKIEFRAKIHKKKQKKIFSDFFYFLYFISKAHAQFRGSSLVKLFFIVKLSFMIFSDFSKYRCKQKSLIFFLKEIASISLQIWILRPKLGRHIFFRSFWAAGRPKTPFYETPYWRQINFMILCNS